MSQNEEGIETIKVILTEVYNAAVSNTAEKISSLLLAPEIKTMVIESLQIATEVKFHRLASGNMGVLMGLGAEGMLMQLTDEEYQEFLNFAKEASSDAERLRGEEEDTE